VKCHDRWQTLQRPEPKSPGRALSSMITIRRLSPVVLTAQLALLACGGGEAPAPSTPTPPSPPAPTNTVINGVPSGWFSSSVNQGWSIVTVVPANDTAGTLTLTAPNSAGQTGVMGQQLNAVRYRGRRVRFSAEVRTINVTGRAGLWIRVDGAGRTLRIDDMSTRPIRGSTAFSTVAVVADVPDEALGLVVGLLQEGGGSSELRAVRFELVPTTVSETVQTPTAFVNNEQARQIQFSYAYAYPEPRNLGLGLRPNMSLSADAYLQSALNVMQNVALRRDRVDWPQVRAAAERGAPGASAPSQLWPPIRTALSALGDNHSFLSPATGASLALPSMLRAGLPGYGSQGGTPARELAAQALGRHGWIRTVAFSGGDAPAIAHAVTYHTLIRGVDESITGGACAWIVDARQNGGGNMWPMLTGLSGLLPEGRAGSFVAPDSSRSEWIVRLGAVSGVDRWGSFGILNIPQPYRLRRERPAIALLFGPGTASSGEAMSVAFLGLPTVRTFGQPTLGLSTANAGYPLSDGSTMLVTVSVFADRTGRMYGDRIPPDTVINAPLNQDPAMDQTVAAARRWLDGQPSCAAP
jgi:carboxyl-terminal processing protease